MLPELERLEVAFICLILQLIRDVLNRYRIYLIIADILACEVDILGQLEENLELVAKLEHGAEGRPSQSHAVGAAHARDRVHRCFQ